MNLLEESINKSQSLDLPSATTSGGDTVTRSKIRQLPLPLLSVLALALGIRLWFNFATVHANACASADASEYLRYADALAKIIAGQTHGPIAAPLKEFVITGPSLPVFLLLASALAGQPFDPTNSAIALTAQSMISALTAGLIYLLARTLYDSKTALRAGIFAAFYPAFIVNSGRLYSETLATFIECLAVLLLVRGFGKARALLPGTFWLRGKFDRSWSLPVQQ